MSIMIEDSALHGQAPSGDGTGADRDMFRAGELVHDRYRVVRLIGKGGMGEVYEAEDTHNGRRLALKTVLQERIGNEKVVRRFRQEAELSQRISHPNVLNILDVFLLRRGDAMGEIPCMVMELLNGESLADFLQERGCLRTEEALPIVLQMASALSASHRAGVVHRDLKPDNVFLMPESEDGGLRTVLTDFGVARNTTGGSFDQKDSLTATNVILGTPFYMAPEQLELETATPSTDIYTFGLVIYEMVTGTLPFLAQSTLQTVFKRVKEDPASPREHAPDLDPVWESTILRCLERDPEDRYQSADQIAAALQGLDEPVLPDPSVSSEAPSGERVPVLWLVVVGLVVVGLAVALVIFGPG